MNALKLLELERCGRSGWKWRILSDEGVWAYRTGITGKGLFVLRQVGEDGWWESIGYPGEYRAAASLGSMRTRLETRLKKGRHW